MLRVFLDSKDLINLIRRQDPVSVEDARRWFAQHDATLLLSYTTVSEFVPPDEPDKLRIRSELQELERFPTTFIRLGDLSRAELVFADKAIAHGHEYRFNPDVDRFWKTFWHIFS